MITMKMISDMVLIIIIIKQNIFGEDGLFRTIPSFKQNPNYFDNQES